MKPIIPVSVCITTFNEELKLPLCLKNLDFVDEIIIVDSGSTDKTVFIAEQYTSKIYQRDFDNYINQKNYCLSKAKNNWVLALDADEVVSLELKQELLLILQSQLVYDGYFIPRLSFYLNRWIKHGGWYPNYQIRFFNKEKGHFSGLLVHETVQITGEITYLKNPLLHYSYNNISEHVKTINRYSDLTAMEKHKLGKKSSILFAILEGMWKFFSMFFLRFGFLDGKAGLVIAIMGSYYNFLKYIKLYELNKKSDSKEYEIYANK
ncbi:MAG: glycosyltransferase family 2 protein [Leptospiraceae bacterium]|nr:glycosyltransferase family 2 protein [Leptospiraceae bacterium]MCP5493681.1 glycosyltransferase family 2 protein [Leptospiraceae bacterium]